MHLGPLCHEPTSILFIATNTCKIFVIKLELNAINSKNSRIERIFDADKGGNYKLRKNEAESNSAKFCALGGVTKMVFNSDCSSFVVGYGDGSVRLWGRDGANCKLRSVLVPAVNDVSASEGISHALMGNSSKNNVTFSPVTGLNFTNDSKKVMLCRGNQIQVINLSANENSSDSKNATSDQKWELPTTETITAASLSMANQKIIVVSENFDDDFSTNYRIFDLLGRQVGSTQSVGAMATCVEWSPNGRYGIIGLADGALILIDDQCVQLITSKMNVQSSNYFIDNIYWQDQLSISTTQGQIISVSIFGTYQTFLDNVLSQTSANQLKLTNSNFEKNFYENLTTKEAIVNFQIGGPKIAKILALTTSQIYIWSVDRVNTPCQVAIPRNLIGGMGATEQTRTGLENVKILLNRKFFVIYNHETAYTYEYQGRQLATIRFQKLPISIRTSSENVFALSKDNSISIYNFQESGQKKSIQLKENPKSGNFTVSHNGQIAYLNNNNEAVYYSEKDGKSVVLKPNVKDLKFNSSEGINSLAVLCENQVFEYLALDLIFKHDRSLLMENSYNLPNSDFASGSRSNFENLDNFGASENFAASSIDKIESYLSDPISLVVLEPNNVHLKTSAAISKFTDKNLKNPSTLRRLCQTMNKPIFWACLAAASLEVNDGQMAQLAYASLGKTAPVDLILDLSASFGISGGYGNNKKSQTTNPIESQLETLISSNQIAKAIVLLIKHSRWNQAIRLAVQHNQELDLVVGMREQYLKNMKIPEYDEKFKNVRNKVSYNLERIESRFEELSV